MSAFRITDGKGFSINFANGYSISVQFGYCNYCDNYDRRPSAYSSSSDAYTQQQARLGAEGSRTAECAVLDPLHALIQLPEEFGGDLVTNRSSSNDVLALMNWAASLPKQDKP